jgi:hypothetical protein
MKKLIMSLAVFAATYLLLSIEISDRPIFAHLHELTSPATRGLQGLVEGAFGKGYEGTRSVGKQLFYNTLPAAQSARNLVPKNFKAPEESLSEAEKKELNNLIKNYSR